MLPLSRLGVWSYYSSGWQASVLGTRRKGLPCPSEEAARSTSQESCRWRSCCGGEWNSWTVKHMFTRIFVKILLVFIVLLLFCMHRDMTEVTQKAGSFPPWLAGSSIGWSVLQTHSVAGAGEGRWPQRTDLVHLPYSSWRGLWWVNGGKLAFFHFNARSLVEAVGNSLMSIQMLYCDTFSLAVCQQ